MEDMSIKKQNKETFPLGRHSVPAVYEYHLIINCASANGTCSYKTETYDRLKIYFMFTKQKYHICIIFYFLTS